MKSPGPKWVWMTGTVIAASVTMACTNRNAYVPPPPPKVTVAKPVTDDVVEYAEFPGVARASKSVQLLTRVNGYLERIEFEDGANVKKGDLLFVIEQEPFEVALRSKKAALEKAKASLQLAELQLSRSEQLAASRSVSQEELDIEIADRNSARAEVASAEAALKQAELDLSYTEVRSPIDGRIGRHLVDVGNLVRAETTILAHVEAIDPIYVYFNISESDYLHFVDLIRSNVLPDPRTHPPELFLSLANESGFPHKGRLDFLDLGVNTETGTLNRRGVFPNPDGDLVPGIFVRMRAALGSPRPELLVDERSIGSDQRGDYVLVVDNDNTVQYRPVKLGIEDSGRRVVKSGVEPDEWVITNGLQRARPGAKVDPQRESAVASTSDAKHAAASEPSPEESSDSKQEG